MSRSSKELADDFHKMIVQARKERQWSQQQLAKKMAETVNVIKAAESGKQPTDAVIRKFEKVLNIQLMVERSSQETRFVNSGAIERHDFRRLLQRFEVISVRPISVHALWLAQDDPKKNTAVLASKRGDMTLHKTVRSVPKRGIILEPLCGKVFGPEDHALLTEQHGALVGLDCSWAHIESSVERG